MLSHINKQDLKNTLTEFFLEDFIVFFFLLYSLINQFTNFINIIQQIMSFKLTKAFY